MHLSQIRRTLLAQLRIPTYLLLLQYLVTGILIGLIDAGNSSSAGPELLVELVLCGVAIGLWYINGTSLNDFSDFEIDMINLKDDPARSLVVRLVNKKQLLAIACAAGVLALAIMGLLGINFFVLMATMLFLNWTYSCRPILISRRGVFAPILLPLGYVLLPTLAGYFIATSQLSADYYFLVVSLYFLFLARILLKDHRDVVGDAKFNKKTVLLKYGNKRVCQFSALSTLAGVMVVSMGLYEILGVALIPILFFTGLAIMFLYYLSLEQEWIRQKPLITLFGRSSTTILLLISTAFALQLSSVALSNKIIVILSLSGIAMYSIIDIAQQQAR